VLKTDNLPTPCAAVMKSGNLNFLETSGPVQACNGTALPFYPFYLECQKPAHTSKCLRGLRLRRGAGEDSALQSRYAAYVGSSLPKFRNSLSVTKRLYATTTTCCVTTLKRDDLKTRVPYVTFKSDTLR